MKDRIVAFVAFIIAVTATFSFLLSIFGSLHPTRSLVVLEPRWLWLLALGGTGLVAWLAFLVAAARARTRAEKHAPLKDDSSELDHDELSHEWADDARRRLFLMKLIVESDKHIVRITESLSYKSRALAVTNSTTISIPPDYRGMPLVVPVLLQPRGHMLDRLEVLGNNERRVSTLSRENTVEILEAIVEDLVSSMVAKGARKDAETTASLEFVLELALGVVRSSDSEHGHQRYRELVAVSEAIAGRPGVSAEAKKALLQFVGRLSELYPVCILTERLAPPAPKGSMAQVPVYQRFTVRYVRSPSYSLWRDRSRDARGLRSLLLPIRSAIALASRLRGIIGVRTPLLRYSLSNADRAASYHLQINAPNNMYVADRWVEHDSTNKIDPPPGEDPPVVRLSSIRPVDGQALTHFYSQKTSGLAAYNFVTQFRESPPGSVGEAMISSGGVAALLIALYIANGESEILAIVAPVVFAGLGTGSLWRGVVFTRQPYGGQALARLASIVTALTAGLAVLFTALWIAVRQCQDVEAGTRGCDYRPGLLELGLDKLPEHVLPVLIVVASANFVVMFVLWSINVLAEMRLINFGERPRIRRSKRTRSAENGR